MEGKDVYRRDAGGQGSHTASVGPGLGGCLKKHGLIPPFASQILEYRG